MCWVEQFREVGDTIARGPIQAPARANILPDRPVSRRRAAPTLADEPQTRVQCVRATAALAARDRTTRRLRDVIAQRRDMLRMQVCPHCHLFLAVVDIVHLAVLVEVRQQAASLVG